MGGSNAHAVVEQPSISMRSNYVFSYSSAQSSDDLFDDNDAEKPYTLLLSANDATSLNNSIRKLCKHLINPRVKADLADIAFTLSERRTRLWHRAFITTKCIDLKEKDFVTGKVSGQHPKIAMVFTGQGSQWPRMGKAMVEAFPWTRTILEELDQTLQAMEDPPKWSITSELVELRTVEHMRKPEFSQTLVTALQICLLAVLESWGVKPSSVVGHSSGEIAAAYAAGLLNRTGAITAAFYRGRAAKQQLQGGETETDVGMLAVGLSANAVTPYLADHSGSAWIACFNSPDSVTISGKSSVLKSIGDEIVAKGYFARPLLVNLAYHSPMMDAIGNEYIRLLLADDAFRSLDAPSDVTMYSSTTADRKKTPTDALFWKENLLLPVRFDQALQELITRESPTVLIEIGPSGALAGPIAKILQAHSSTGNTLYLSSWARKSSPEKSLLDVAGHMFVLGMPINMSQVNDYNKQAVRTIVDLPNYSWNHSIKYWHENAASKDWRFKKFITHELLGSKIPGALWSTPTWRKHLNLADVPWLRDHVIGPDVVMPGAGYATLALEAMYQMHCALSSERDVGPNDLAYRFRNVRFNRAMVVDEDKPSTLILSLTRSHGNKNWYEYQVQTVAEDTVYEHCVGLIRIQPPVEDETLDEADRLPLRHAQSPELWYKAQREVGMGFGPEFQKIKSIESVRGQRTCRSILSLQPPSSKWEPATYYPVHPAVLDACLQTVHPANVCGERSGFQDVMVPSFIEDMVINKLSRNISTGISLAESVYTGRGRKDTAKSWGANISVHDPKDGRLLVRIQGLNYIKLDVDQPPDPHVFLSSTWKPDISFFRESQQSPLLPVQAHGVTEIGAAIDLICHKIPKVKVVEINLIDSNTSSLWFQDTSNQARAAYDNYEFLSADPKVLIAMQELHASRRNTSFHLMNAGHSSLSNVLSGRFDLAIVKASSMSDDRMEGIIQNLDSLLEPNACVLVTLEGGVPDNGTFFNTPNGHPKTRTADRHTTLSPEYYENRDSKAPGLSNGVVAKELLLKHPYLGLDPKTIIQLDAQSLLIRNNALSSIHSINAFRCLEMIHLDSNPSPGSEALKAKLEQSGWSVHNTPLDQFGTKTAISTLLVVDDVASPMLTRITKSQWQSFKEIVCAGKPLIWVSVNVHASGNSDPGHSLVKGMFRTIRRELPDARLTILDIESEESLNTGRAVEQVLQRLDGGAEVEPEYLERDGLLHIERLMPDTATNDFKTAEHGHGFEPVVKGFYDEGLRVQLRALKVGTLESLTWCETDTTELSLEPETVEIEVMSVGVNFKVCLSNF
jgi:acyl transferase domain-containing protein